jgi:hypothetical protein
VYFKGYSTTNDSIELGNYSMWDLAIVQELYSLTKEGYTVPSGFSSKKEHEKYLRGKL